MTEIPVLSLTCLSTTGARDYCRWLEDEGYICDLDGDGRTVHLPTFVPPVAQRAAAKAAERGWVGTAAATGAYTIYLAARGGTPA